MCKSEYKRGKAAEQHMETDFETVVGRGVYTRGSWRKAVTYSDPLLYPGQKLLIKFVFLVEVPGDLSDHGVGVAHKAEAVLQQLKKTRNNNTWRVRILGYSSPSLTISMLWPPARRDVATWRRTTASGLVQEGLLGVGGPGRGAYL